MIGSCKRRMLCATSGDEAYILWLLLVDSWCLLLLCLCEVLRLLMLRVVDVVSGQRRLGMALHCHHPHEGQVKSHGTISCQWHSKPYDGNVCESKQSTFCSGSMLFRARISDTSASSSSGLLLLILHPASYPINDTVAGALVISFTASYGVLVLV